MSGSRGLIEGGHMVRSSGDFVFGCMMRLDLSTLALVRVGFILFCRIESCRMRGEFDNVQAVTSVQ